MNDQKMNPISQENSTPQNNQDTEQSFNSNGVACNSEMTGMVATPPENRSQSESYQALTEAPTPEPMEQENPNHDEKTLK